MIRQVDFTGKSGAVYRYRTLEQGTVVPPAGANYVIARMKPKGVEILSAGETDNLAARTWRPELDEALSRYADATILTRLNVRVAVREFERDDLAEAYLQVIEHRDAA